MHDCSGRSSRRRLPAALLLASPLLLASSLQLLLVSVTILSVCGSLCTLQASSAVLSGSVADGVVVVVREVVAEVVPEVVENGTFCSLFLLSHSHKYKN